MSQPTADQTSVDHDLLAGCALVDRSERGKLALSGSQAVEFLGGQVTNELADLTPGDGRYAAFLTHKGKMLGDLRILAVGSPGGPVSELLLDTERVALQALFDMVRRFKIGYDVELHKRTVEYTLLSLIGERTRTVLSQATGGDADRLAENEHSHIPSRLGEFPVRLIATDVGVDVLCAAEHGPRVNQVLRDFGAEPISEQEAEVIRVISGRPRYGVDIDDSTIPQEAGLNERAVSFTKGCYVGQETVARMYYKGKPNRHLRGLRFSRAVVSGTPLMAGDRQVGTVGSSVLSPVHGPIGLALVRREAQPGDTLTVGDDGASAQVVDLPFGLQEK